MAEQDRTLGALFALDPDQLSESADRALRASTAMRALSAVAGAHADAVGTSAITNVSRVLHSALDTSVSSILSGAWHSYRDLQRYGDPAEYPPDQPVTCTLSSHTIEVSHQPVVEVLYNRTVVGTLTFDLALQIEVESAVLSIMGGRIMDAILGRCTVSGTLKYGDATLVNKTAEPFNPPPLRFAAGIPLRMKERVAAG
jgi:hypothetical protein